MGNDGGSIARRDELVKVKIGKPVHEAARQRKARWLLCSLSKKPLKQPVVADGLGRMYNKEALVDWLIQVKVNEGKGKGADVDAGMTHIKRLKDVTELKLHENTTAGAKGKAAAGSPSNDEDDEAMATPFACPLTGRPMNGSHRFVYIRAAGSGAVMSESGLKAVLGSASSSSSTAVCPITSVPFEPGYIAQKAPASTSSSSSSIAPLVPANVGDVIPINPTAEEEVILRAVLQASAGKKEKKGKRKNGDAAAVGPEDGEVKAAKRPSPPSKPDEPEATSATKRQRTEEPAGGDERSRSPPSATAAVAASIAAMAAREAKAREKPLSANVLKGIYGK